MVIKLALCLFGVQAAMVFFLAWNQPEPNLASCRASERIYGSDQSLMLRQKAPTHFPLMPSRYVAMVQAARGDECTGTTAVGFNGRDFVQTGASDDPAIMELVPKLSRWFGMSLANTYDVLILSVISSGILIGYAGFWNLFADRRPRLIGTAVFLCVGVAEARLADEYIFQISPLIAGIPWLVHLGLHGTNRVLTASAVLLAFCCSWCSLIRSGSLVICLTFLVTLFVARHRTQKPFLPLLLIAVACIPSVILARSVVRGRDAALARVHERAKAENSHAFWHTLYIGFGFIPNSAVPAYRDGVAEEKARSIDPTASYASPKYQAILRRELWNLARRRPALVIGTVAAKACIVLLLAAILLYPVRRLIFAEPATFWVDAAFLLTIGMSSMNALVAVPKPSYLLTFLCLTFLYSSIKLCQRLELPGMRGA